MPVVAICASSIGGTASTASLGAQIEPEVRLIGLDPRGGPEQLYERLNGDLELDRSQKWPVAFERILRLGSVATPFLDRIVRERGDAQVYLHLDTARMLSLSGVDPRRWLRFEARYEDRDALRARLIAFVALALGGELGGGVDPRLLSFARGRVRGVEVEPIERAAACAALSRFTVVTAESLFQDSDPLFRPVAEEPALTALSFRVLGATAARRLRAWQQSSVEPRATALVFRGYFLSEAVPEPDRADDQSRIVWALRQGRDPLLRQAAVLHLARSEKAEGWFLVLPEDVRRLLVTDAALSVALAERREFRRLLEQAGALDESPLATPDEQARLTIAFLDSATPEQLRRRLVAGRGSDREELAARLACLGVALRLLDEAGTGSEPSRAEDLVTALPPIPERRFAQFAADPELIDPIGPQELRAIPGSLRAPLRVLAEGGMTRSALRTVVQDELWRLGGLPSRPRFDAEMALLRDALIAGSEFGNVFDLPGSARVAPPGGLPIEDPAFRVIAALFQALSEPARAPVR